ncbi:hypothetical protein BaRGS_00012912 [Batillaria attramentaria]|uniref:Uncharacterized protein n=1 Tax=Batillaria attramentaria TaxID=370345 RepID=A0ABD0L948_9CAEN
MGPMGPRMSHPGGRMPGPMNPYDSLQNYGMRGPPPNTNMGPGPGGMPPMSMPGGPGGPGPGQGNRGPWPPTSSSEFVSQGGPPVTGGPPGTPIMPSPQDSAGSGDAMYMMKPGPGGPPGMMPGPGGFPMGGPDGPMGPMGPGDMAPVMNGDMDVMKNSPANGRGTPRDDLPPVSGSGDMGPYSMGPPYQDGVSFLGL